MLETDEPVRYSAAVHALVEPLPLNELGPGQPHRALRPQLEALSHAALWPGQTVVDAQLADCCRAGLWLLHNYLDESHTISQSVETSTGTFWHGIMHRREGDYSNAKYWFRRVDSDHRVFEQLGLDAKGVLGRAASSGSAAKLAAGDWDPFTFVDLCRAARPGSTDETVCRELQQLEWRRLFDHCYRGAVGMKGLDR
jgi:hypothetical protein